MIPTHIVRADAYQTFDDLEQTRKWRLAVQAMGPNKRMVAVAEIWETMKV